MLTIKQKLSKNVINALGWRTKRHLVIIESDDWGSIRMPNRKVYESLLAQGIKVDQNYFDKYDALESADDLTALFEVLSSVKDKNGNSAVITPLAVCANPDFEKIEACNRKQYHYESVVETYKRSNNTINSYDLVKQGIESGLYLPQFHGREHVHVKRWMEGICSNDVTDKIAYDNRCMIISRHDNKRIPVYKTCFPAFAYDSIDELTSLQYIMEDGLRLFENVYGYKASSLCPPCGIVNNKVLEFAMQYGVVGLQAGQHFVPQSDGSIKKIDKVWGAKSKTGQIFWRRNCTFEPARNHDLDWVDSCLAEMEIAFRWRKPAAINSHRVNFIGSIFPENRDKTLAQLSALLKAIVKRWPDVEFISSETICNLLCK